MITDEQRIALRKELGNAILQIQASRGLRSAQPWDPAEFIAELLSAMLSLSAMMAQINALLDKETFLSICEYAANHQWQKKSGH
jgi:hypothetical protein